MAISPQLAEYNAEMTEKFGLSFTLLSDRHNHVARQFGIVFRFPDDLAQIYKSLNMDIGKFNGDASWELPMPARYVIDRRGVICSAIVNYDYTFRPEPSETLAALREIATADSETRQ